MSCHVCLRWFDVVFSQGSPAQAKTDRSDVDLKSMSPLCTFGRDEEYIMNKLWLNGISSIILDGVGDGMIVWCALKNRIPIMCLYDREIHKKTIEAFLQDKIMKKMEEATPSDTRWYRTNAQLGCRENEEGVTRRVQAKAAAAKAKAAAALPALAALAAAKAKATTGTKRSAEKADGNKSSSASSSKVSTSSKSSSASKKKRKKGQAVEAVD